MRVAKTKARLCFRIGKNLVFSRCGSIYTMSCLNIGIIVALSRLLLKF